MMKYFLITCASLFVVFTVTAQTFSIEESAPMDEPEEGWLKVLQLKNGNTALVHLSKENGLNIKIYDAKRKLIAEGFPKPAFGNKGDLRRGGGINAILTIKDDIVLFVGAMVDKAPTLFRVIVDSSTGKLKKEEEIGRLKEMGMKDGYAIAFGGVPLPRFEIRKDPDSDNYGIALFNTLVSERSKRIELIHYGSDNQQLSRAFYVSPNEEFKYMELIDFTVMGDKKLIASAYMYNTGDDKVSYLSLASLDKGAANLQVKQLEFTLNKKFSVGLFRYNKKSDLLALVGLDKLGRKKNDTYYNPILTLIDPKNLSVVYTKDIELPNVNGDYKKIFGEDEQYQAVPQDFYVNDDGTYTVVFEETNTKQITSNGHTTTTVKLGSIAVAILDDKTKEKSSYLIPKSHAITYVSYSGFVEPYDYNPMYISKRQESAQYLKDATQYKSFAYVNGQKGNYVFFNDVIENLEKIKNGKLTTISGISASDAFVCTMKDGKMTRDLLFGTPSGKEHNFAMFTVSDYDRSTGTYITVKLENDHGKKLKVIWVKL